MPVASTSQSAWLAYLPLITIFASGIFSLLVSLSAHWLSSRKDNQKELASRQRQRFLDRESMYMSILDCVELLTKYRVNLDTPDTTLTDRLQTLYSKVLLLEDGKFRSSFETVITRLNVWQDAHYEANPKKTGNIMILSSTDKYHKEDERKARHEMDTAILEMVVMMKQNLSKLDNAVYKTDT